MGEIIGVRFKSGGKQYYFAPGELQIAVGQGVIVETARGPEYGTCTRSNTEISDTAIPTPLRPVIRIATERDLEQVARSRAKEREALTACQAKIAALKLDMKLVDVEYSFEGNKILFFFTAEERVDFRALVRDLASQFHARIEMRQIGVRDEARMVGGLGICGKPFCCATFLEEFQPVSIKMAKTQSLSLNPTKISGTCGRLMCCLKYEQGAYEDAVRRCPKAESFVETPDGVGTVSNVNLLRETVKVRLEESTEPAKYYRNSEIAVVRNGKGKRPEGYVPPPKAELEARRYVPEPTEQQAAALPQDALSAALADIFAASDGQKNPKSRRGRTGGKGHPPDQKPSRPAPSRPAPPRPAPERPAAQTGPVAQTQPGEKKKSRRQWRRPRGGGGGNSGGGKS